MKRIVLLLFSVLITVMLNPIDLDASDEVFVSDNGPIGVIEFDIQPVRDDIVETDETPLYELVGELDVAATVATAPEAIDDDTPQEVVLPADAISVAGHVIPIVNVGTTAVDAGDHVNKYGTKFLYGHNSPAVFGDLVYVGVGNVFMVSDGGVTSTYQVAEVQIFEKASETTLSSNGVTYRMAAVANGKGRYDMALMTCYGTMYGNGDASHRLVIFANRV